MKQEHHQLEQEYQKMKQETETNVQVLTNFTKLSLVRILKTHSQNLEIILRIYLYLSLMITNCSGDRSFSKLKFIKSKLITRKDFSFDIDEHRM